MELSDIKKHWQNLAKTHTTTLFATTKTQSIKLLEIAALSKCIKEKFNKIQKIDILEVGCGNGQNIFRLAKEFENAKFSGIDYVEEMVQNAKSLRDKYNLKNVNFEVGDILELNCKQKFDVVFTDRCIINLNSINLQKIAVKNLANQLKDDGILILIENSSKTYAKQNMLRQTLKLTARTNDLYNLFIDEDEIINFAINELDLKLLKTDDFSSLHDLMLYVLLPCINGGAVEYNHPLINATTELLLNSKIDCNFGDFGQNRLFLFAKNQK